MTFNSALEDLRATTLKAVVGSLRRLEYLSDLRDGEAYVHWGLARIHGELAASKALAQEHRSVLSRILATPIQNLLEDLQTSSTVAGLAPGMYVARLREHVDLLLPVEPGAGSEHHLSSVLRALSSLSHTPSLRAIPPPS